MGGFLGIVDEILKKSRNFPCNSTVHKYIEIYKGNSEKYKGKIKNQDISIFGHTNIFDGYLRWLAAFLTSIRFFWHPYWLMYACQMPDVIDVINVIYVINDIYDMYGALTYTICRYVNIGVKRSVWTSGMQPSILNIQQIYLYGQKLKYPGS